jgi:PAS domain S-box-containing protein
VQSVLLGSGIGAMHYIGMSAMRVDAHMRYDALIFTASIVVAVALSYVALQFKQWAEAGRGLSETRSLVVAAMFMGMAVSAMHYTGMAAVYYFPILADVTTVVADSSWASDSVTNLVIYTVLIMLSLMIGAVHISRRMELVRQLEGSKARQTNIVDNMVDGLIVIDHEGNIDAFNPAAEKIFGYRIHEVLGKNVSILMSGHDHEQHDNYIKRYHTKKDSEVIGIGREILGRHKDGTLFPIEIALSMFTIEGKTYFSGVVRDIRERKEAEKTVLEARRIAEVASHAKSEFLNRVSHELRTPMNAIVGFSQLLEADMDKLGEEHQIYIKELQSASQRLLKLIDNMLELSSIETDRLEVDIEAVLLFDVIHASITDMLPEAQQAGIMLKNMVDDLELVIMADVSRLQQVLHHLLSNAIKHNRPGGQVSVGCDRVKHDRLRISITDTGEGLSEEKLAELFTPFDRLNKNERLKGAGLGLAISKHLMELMHGAIGVESRQGVGSTFWLELELMLEENAEPRQTPARH